MPNNPSHGGECVRHAPSVVVVHDTVVTIRPTVLATDRCGEWEPKGARTCAECRHWSRETPGNFPELAHWGTCDQSGPIEATNLICGWEDGLLTRENFACVLWEPKENGA
jgi:hypothetical protein